jgi:hypothetical protein
MAQVSGSLITRHYTGFNGVDFANRKDEVALYHSPDALNMYKNYKNSGGNSIETRPDIDLLDNRSEPIFGFFFYTYNKVKHKILHTGSKLYDDENVIYEQMNQSPSIRFIYENKLYILDGKNYLVYDGTSVKEVEGFIPTTSTGRTPLGGGTILEDINLLSPFRKNKFVCDGISKEYALDTKNIDTDYKVKVWIINDKGVDEEITDFDVNYTDGVIIFKNPPSEPFTTGSSNLTIEFKKEVKGYKERITGCTLVELFDNRVFFSGNKDFPNTLWHSSLNRPDYISDLDYYNEGNTDASIKSIVAGNNALWVLKEPSQTNTTIFYHNPTIDSDYGKVYPSIHSSISVGCVGSGINFNDAIVFFSDRGMEAITGDVTTEQVISHKSTFIDNKLLNENDYKNMKLIEWEGYLLVITGNHIYLADSRSVERLNGNYEYNWYYWEFDKVFNNALVNDGILYLITDNEIYTLTNNKKDRKVLSYWTTKEDECNYPHYQKTTNKKGCTSDVEGEVIDVLAKVDNNAFDLIGKYTNVKGYIVPKIKKKKFKSVALKFSSNKPFSLYSSTLEVFVGSYVKR